MIDQLVALIVDEGKWLSASMSFALVAVIVVLYRHRHSDLPARRRVLAVMNLFFGVTIGTMAFGPASLLKEDNVISRIIFSLPKLWRNNRVGFAALQILQHRH